MSNDDLVELVRNNPDYQKYHSPGFDKVLKAMLRVDRKDFLFNDPFGLVYVDSDALEKMFRSLSDPIGSTDKQKFKNLKI